MIPELRKLLDESGVKYEVISHDHAFTGQEISSSMNVPSVRVAKTVVLWADGNRIIAVLPASRMVSFSSIREALGVETVEILRQRDLQELFPESDIGAMPPFGNRHITRTVVDSHFPDGDIIFRAGDHAHVVKMNLTDFLRLAGEKKYAFSVPVGMNEEDRPQT